MPGPPFLAGEAVSLHAIQTEDGQFCQELLTDPRVRRRIEHTEPLTIEAEREWIERQDERDGFTFLICRSPETDESETPAVVVGGNRPPDDGADDRDPLGLGIDDEPERVGTIGFAPKNDVWGTAEVGYSVAPEHWGNGYCTEALELCCRYAFEERRLDKLYALTLATNPASARVLKKAGFEKEGSFRNEAFVDGERVNAIRYGLLAAEWSGRDRASR